MNKETTLKTAAKRFWPWFSFIFIILISLFIPVRQAFAAPTCDTAAGHFCVEITSLNPSTVDFNQSFVANATISAKALVPPTGKPAPSYNVAYTWIMNPTGLGDFLSNILAEGQVSLTPDASGNAAANITQTFTSGALGLLKSGANAVGLKIQVVSSMGGPAVWIKSNFTINPIQSSTSDRVTISYQISPSGSGPLGLGSEVSGMYVQYYAAYIPAGQTSPATDSSLVFNWDFGDSKSGTGLTPTHTYSNPGTYSVAVTVLKNGKVVAQSSQSVNVSGNPTTPKGDWLTTILNEIVSFIFGLLEELVYLIFSVLVAPLIKALLSIHVYTDTFVAVIYTGWEVIRNLCNILFIVAIIIIAMATLFRVDSYKYKDLLVQLLIAALLINFSLVISQAVLGIADTMQVQFLGTNVTATDSLAQNLMLNSNSQIIKLLPNANTVNANNTNAASVQGNSFFGGIIQSFFWLVLSTGTLAVFAAIAVFLLVRIIALWLLLMVSPAAYAVGVLPATAHYRDEWWKNFLKYAFFTPIMAFFLNMASIMANSAKTTPILKQAIDNPDSLGFAGLGGFFFNITSNILILVFLMAALKVADLAGIYGAQGITDLAQKGMFAPVGLAKTLGMAGAQKLKTKYDEKTLRLANSQNKLANFAYGALHAPSFIKAIGTDSTKEREKMKHLTEAAALKIKRQTPLLKREGRDPLYHAQLDQGEERLNEVYGHYTGNETEEVRRLVELETRARNGDQNAKMMLLAQMLRAAPNKHLNQFMQDKGLDYNQANIIGLLDEWESAGIMSHSINEEFQTALSEQGYKIADFNLTELSDGKNGIHVEKVKGAPGQAEQYAIKGMQEWEAYNEWIRNEVERTGGGQAEFEAMQKGLLTDSSFSTQKAAFLSNFASTARVNRKTGVVGTRDFNEHDYQNANLAQNQILKRDVNASKLERKPAIFHNSLATTDSTQVNGDNKPVAVFGEAGNHVLTHLAGTDVWGASRGQWTEKQKEWLFKMVKDHDLPAIKDMVRTEYKKENARLGKFVSNAEVNKQVDLKTRYLLSTVYASRFQAGTDQVVEQVKAVTDAAGVAANPNKYAKKGDKLETILDDRDMETMINRVRNG